MRRLSPLAITVLLGCGHAPGAERPSVAEVRAYHYQDSSGLLVGTYGGNVRQRLPAGTTAEVRALADYVRIDPSRGYDPTDPTADRRAPDAVTSASATAGGGRVSSEWRFEGLAAFDVDREVRGNPVSVGALARASTEPDYRSASGALRGRVELFERNTSLTAQVGFGRDQVRPVEVFGGQEPLWPAGHHRWAASVAASQLLSPSLVLTGGAAATWQRGTLSSPYRRALVRPTLLLPEALPRRRDRYSAYLGLSIALAPWLGLHLQQGAYADSWSVRAFIPSATLAVELDEGILLQASYHLYLQRRARFHAAIYDEVRPVMSGDLRLGAVREQGLSLDLRRALSRGPRLQLPLLAGYQLSVLDYRSVRSRVVAHVFLLGLEATY